MAANCARSPRSLLKRLRISPQQSFIYRAGLFTSRPLREGDLSERVRLRENIENDLTALADGFGIPLPHGVRSSRRDVDVNALDAEDGSTIPPEDSEPRLPRSVQALYLEPMHRQPTHGIRVCDLQLRSYSVRNVEFMADFALRAAYYLNLPAKGPVHLPRITERWTVPRANFIFKKSQENWERVTLRRLVQIQDGDPDVIRRWLGFLRKWCWYGVGLKANVWEFESLDVVEKMDANETAVKEGLDSVNWELVGLKKDTETPEVIEDQLDKAGFGARRPRAVN